jgi:putative transcriptional regulator
MLAILATVAVWTACGVHGSPSSRSLDASGVAGSRPSGVGTTYSGTSGLRAANPPPTRLRKKPPSAGRTPLSTGKFLIATRQLGGPFFSRTVVLLLDYGSDGAMGLIVNRPTGLALTELLPELARLGQRSDTVYLGGPVNPELMVFLIRAGYEPAESHHVVGDVHATGSADALRKVVAEGAAENRFHAYVGYAGWAPGQLDREVMRGDWIVTEAKAELIFDPKLGELWERLVREHEGIQVRTLEPPGPALTAVAGDAAPVMATSAPTEPGLPRARMR